MQAAAFTELVGPDGVSLVDRPTPEPGPDDVRVDVEARSLNRHDLLVLQGDTPFVQESDLPFLSGLDAAGVVDAVGENVEDVTTGDRVLLCPHRTCGTCRYCREGPENLCQSFSLAHGAFGEQLTAPADRLVALPPGVDTTTAAALPTAYVTAQHMLRRAEVDTGDVVFVPGVTGGVGVAAVQLATIRGASTVGTSSSAAKLDSMTNLGLDHAVEATDPDEIREAVEDRVGEVDAVINHLGAEYTQLGLDCLRRGGRMIVCGRTAGRHSEIDVAGLSLRHTRVIGSSMGTQVDLQTLVDLVDAGELDPAIHETYPLAETAAAFEAMGHREHVGKLVVTS